MLIWIRSMLTAAAPGGAVCDMCAAPGGKTAQLATAGLDVTAVDVSGTRLRTLHENLERLGIAAAVVEADALAWDPPALFDGILLDAPCSATGTIRRHPDIPYLKTAADVTHQTDLQRKFLDKYSVCSLERSEGPGQIAALLKRDPSLRLETIAQSDVPDFEGCIVPEGYMRVTPAHLAEKGGVDGFFVARLRKKDTL